MCCGTKEAEIQKLTDLLERPHSLSPSSHTICPLSPSVRILFSSSLSVFEACFFFFAFSPSLTHSFSMSGLLYFDAGPGTLTWPFSSFHLFLLQTQSTAIFLARNNTGLLHAHKSHTLTHTLSQAGMCGNLPLATFVTCI